MMMNQEEERRLLRKQSIRAREALDDAERAEKSACVVRQDEFSALGLYYHGKMAYYAARPGVNNKTLEDIRQNLLNALGSDENISIISATLDKMKYKSVCGENILSVGEMYNNICKTLINRVFEKNLLPQGEKNIFIASRRETNKYINNLFVESFKGYNLEVIVAHPNTYKGLQIADFVAWSFFRQYEYESAKYTNLFRNLVVEDFIIKKA